MDIARSDHLLEAHSLIASVHDELCKHHGKQPVWKFWVWNRDYADADKLYRAARIIHREAMAELRTP